MFDRTVFDEEQRILIEVLGSDVDLKRHGSSFVNTSDLKKNVYVWKWMDLPVIHSSLYWENIKKLALRTNDSMVLQIRTHGHDLNVDIGN
jgi:hypothetical protein